MLNLWLGEVCTDHANNARDDARRIKYDCIRSLADPGGAASTRPPNVIKFFRFRKRFHWKVPTSEVGAPNGSAAPQRKILDPPLKVLWLINQMSQELRWVHKTFTYPYKLQS